MFAKPYLQQGKFKETARTLARYNSPLIQPMLPVYKTIAIEVLAAVNEVELQILKEMLQKLVRNLQQKVQDRNNVIYMEFMKFLTATNLLLLKTECSQYKLDRVVAKQCTSLLRYTKEIRCDKAFLDAGESNRKIGNNDMAFIYFNRYIDLYDAIEDTIKGFNMIMDGKVDQYPEAAFNLVGTIEDAIAKGEKMLAESK